MGQVASARREAAAALHRQGALPAHGQVPEDACIAHGLRPNRSCPRSKRDTLSECHFPERPINQVGPSPSIPYPRSILKHRKRTILPISRISNCRIMRHSRSLSRSSDSIFYLDCTYNSVKKMIKAACARTGAIHVQKDLKFPLRTFSSRTS
jgi:hypothetical protein